MKRRTRWMYQASPLAGSQCIITEELVRIAGILGVSQEHPSSIFLTDTDIPVESIPVTDCRLTKTDMRENRRKLLRWVVEDYGRDKAALKRLGFV